MVVEHLAAPPADLPRAPGLRDRLRLAWARRRTGGRVRAAGPVAVGRRVRFDLGPGAEILLGAGAALGDGCRLHVRGGRVTVGERTVLGARCAVVCHARVSLGAGCLLGDEVVLADIDQQAADVEVPARLQPLRVAPVVVGDGARLGPGAAVLAGVTVGPGAIVGAHAVVTRDVPAAAVVEGVPARVPPVAPGQSSRSSRSRR